MFGHSPALKSCIPLIFGCILGWYCSIPLVITSAVVVILICISLVLVIREQKASVLSGVLFMLLMVFGIFKITVDGKYISGNDIRKFTSAHRSVSVMGTISDESHRTDQSVKFVIQSDSILVDGIMVQTRGGVLVSAQKNAFDSLLNPFLTYGTSVILTGTLMPIVPVRNPGEFDIQRYLFLNDIDARFYLDSITIRPNRSRGILGGFVYPVRRSIARRIDRLIGGDEGNFLKGLVVGERSEIDAMTRSAFVNAGVMHVLAVSGLHVGIVVFMLLIFFQVLRIPEKISFSLICCCLVYYVFLTGSSPSVSRSAIMAIIFLGGRILERKRNIYNTLATCALVLLMVDARQLFQAGFQLSFAAVFSIIFFYPKIYNLKNVLPENLGKNKLIIGAFAIASISVAASLGTLPFSAAYFGKISFIGIIANIVIVPVSNLVLGLGMVAVACSYFSAWVASAYAASTVVLTNGFLWSVKFFGTLPYAAIEIHLSLILSICFYCIVFAFMFLMKKESRKYSMMMLLLGSNLIVYSEGIFSLPSRNLRVAFLDVGQGDAIVVEFPDGKTLLLDAGPRTVSYDAGSFAVIPFLRWSGIRSLDYIVLSHPHSDHLGGIPAVLHEFSIGKIIEAGSTTQSALFDEYHHLIDTLHLNRCIVHAGMRIAEDSLWRCYVVHPSFEFIPQKNRPASNLNNESVVLKIVYGATTVLLEGDAERDAESRIRQLYGTFLKSDLLKVGHHGSRTSSSPPMIECIDPREAVISVGAHNKFHHPSPITLNLFKSRHCHYYRTDEEGAVLFESDGTAWHRVDWR